MSADTIDFTLDDLAEDADKILQYLKAKGTSPEKAYAVINLLKEYYENKYEIEKVEEITDRGELH